MGLNRKHAGFEEIAAGPFQQAGVALFAQNGFVNFPGTLFFDHVGFDQIVADPHAETADRRILRQREIENPFPARRSVIDERFLDRGAGNLIANLDVDLVVADRKRLVPPSGRLTMSEPSDSLVDVPSKPLSQIGSSFTSTSFSSRSTRTNSLLPLLMLRLPSRGPSSSNVSPPAGWGRID